MMLIKILVKYLLPTLFSVAITLPLLNGVLGVWEFERKDENRTFKDSVSINFNHLDALPGEINAYVNDNFSFRTPLLNLYHNTKFYGFKVSPHPDKTIVGNNNWFFAADKGMKLYQGKLNYSNQELEKFLVEWKRRKKYLNERNIKCYWIIAPIKHNVYPEYLPFYVRGASQSRTEQIKEYFQKDLPNLIIDPIDELVKAKEHQKVFYQFDNHWNYSAGYVVSKLLLSRIKSDFPDMNIADIPTYNWKDSIMKKGIHYQVLGVESLSEIDRFPIVLNERSTGAEGYGFPPVVDFPYPWEHERRYVNKKMKTGLKVVIIRDSFGRQLIPFIKEPFKETVFIFDSWQYKLNEPIIETVQPDAVIFIGLESGLEYIVADYE